MTTRREVVRTLVTLPACAASGWSASSLSARAAAKPAGPDGEAIEKGIRALARVHTVKHLPQAGGWLDSHEEPGQTYAQYLEGGRQRVIDRYSTLRVVPIGPLTAGQQRVVNITNEFMRAFYGFKLVTDPPVSLTVIAPEAQRQFIAGAPPQLLTTWLHRRILMPRRQAADAAVLGITANDLWPGDGWNFVFGQATLTERVGVWSMARNGNADGRPAEFHNCAFRTVGTAVHETGHMLGFRHCVLYECGMNGSNNADERDRQPLEFCPECQAKVWWTCRSDPAARSAALAAIARRHGFAPTAQLLARDAKLLAR
jgi:archaemetzincin